MYGQLRLPRASTMAYVQFPRGETPAAPPPIAPAEPPPPPPPLPAASPAALPAVVGVLTALRQVLAQDARGLLTRAGLTRNGHPRDSLAAVASELEAGAIPLAAAVARFRALCGAALVDSWDSGDTAAAQAASSLMDVGNELLRAALDAPDFHPGARAAPGAAAPPAPALPAEPPRPPRPPPVLPHEDYFMPPAEVGEALTIHVAAGALLAPARRAAKGPSGGGGGGGGYGGGGARRSRGAAGAWWTAELQAQLGAALVAVLAPAPAGEGGPPPPALPRALARLVADLRDSAAGEFMRLAGLVAENTRAALGAGAFGDSDEALGSLAAEAHAAAEAHMAVAAPEARRGRVLANADAFAQAVALALEALAAEAAARRPRAASAAAAAAWAGEAGVDDGALFLDADGAGGAAPAPGAEGATAELKPPPVIVPSILHNREPYKHGAWRRTPYAPRPYQALTAYHVVEERSRAAIERKLATGKCGGCDGAGCVEREALGAFAADFDGFSSRCGCLARCTECDASCGCAADPARCLNRAVTERRALRLGEDVAEVDSWGMDCYTRRNIQDAVLQSQAYGRYDAPDYAAGGAAGGVGVGGGTGAGAALSSPAAQHAALAAEASAAPSPAPPGGASPADSARAARAAVERAAAGWIERALVPAIQRQGGAGWNIILALEDVKARAAVAGDAPALAAAAAVEARARLVGANYFRLHPKGVGLVCRRPGGLPRLTFVEEYLGEIHEPWRWFELCDAAKKVTGDELPDFYNIVLERPRDDPAGCVLCFGFGLGSWRVVEFIRHESLLPTQLTPAFPPATARAATTSSTSTRPRAAPLPRACPTPARPTARRS
jgi:hypothetical protein